MKKLELTREIKILLLQVLKQNEISFAQANQLTDYFSENKLVEKISINFVDYSGMKAD
jgi:hypothetical protein